MPRVAFVKNSVTVNVIEVEDIDKIPDLAVIGVDEQGNLIRKSDCELHVITEVGSRDDLYEYGVGFYRQHDVTNIESIEQVADMSGVEVL